MLTTRLRRHRVHLGAVVIDNALSSASNFASSIIALRVGGADGFAAAGISLVLLRVAIAVSRSYSVEPLVTLAPTAQEISPRDALATLRAATSSSLVLAALSCLWLRLFDVSLSPGLLLLMTVGLVTMAQGEALRSLCLLRRRYAPALWFDGLWVALIVATAPWLLALDDPGAVLATWAATGAVAMVATVPVLRRCLEPDAAAAPRPLPTPRVRVGIAGETAVDRVGNQLSIAVIAAAATPVLATGITAARTVLSPLNPILFALFNFLLPVSAQADDRRRQGIIRALMVGAPLAVLAVAVTAAAAPGAWIGLVVGPAWSSARPVFVPVSLLFASAIVRQLVVAVARGGALVAEARARRYLASALAFAPCLLVLSWARWALPALYLTTVLSLAGALVVGQGIVNVLRDRETGTC